MGARIVEEVEREVRRRLGAKPRMQVPMIDARTNRIVFRGTAQAPGEKRMIGISTMRLGRKGGVMLQCYAEEGEFERYLPVFEKMAASLQFDKGHGFKIPATPPVARKTEATQAAR